jgi:ribonuclease HI
MNIALDIAEKDQNQNIVITTDSKYVWDVMEEAKIIEARNWRSKKGSKLKNKNLISELI